MSGRVEKTWKLLTVEKIHEIQESDEKKNYDKTIKIMKELNFYKKQGCKKVKVKKFPLSGPCSKPFLISYHSSHVKIYYAGIFGLVYVSFYKCTFLAQIPPN